MCVCVCVFITQESTHSEMALLCSLLEEKLKVEIVDYTLCVCVFITQGSTHSEMALLRSLLEEEKFKVERLEEQINDLTELHQNEMAILKQDMSSMEEKIEYRLDERTTDLSDLVDNCQTRVRPSSFSLLLLLHLLLVSPRYNS